ncbi:MAG TPA: hydantoinase B/oxoprolinase family protein [Tepidisphaeraceae bacterium]|jgi:N-methylhydantoinase B|nr:hydantoinase B/oxoprolinase family protein [Tepidisphaeraceae bacterium]
MRNDPIELELMRNLFEAAADEMGVTLGRVAFSANIKERRDYSCALFDSSGQLLSQAAHIPVHLGSMPASVGAVIERLGKLNAGDVAIVNDPFAGGTHLPDITIVSPIVHRGELAGYAANRAHHSDVGGVSPGSMTLSRHIDQEGIRIEPTLMYRGGVRDEELLNKILLAVRTKDERIGDLDAQLSANQVGSTALLRMIERHGLEAVVHYGRALLDYSQRFMAAALLAIPDGEYRFDDAMDDDGAGSGPTPIRVVVSIIGDRAAVDLTACPDQVAGCINCPRAVARSAVYYCFACLVEENVPLNGGSFRNIDVITRPGSVVDAVYPAAVVAGNTETSQRIVDVVFGALAQAMPGRIPAASCGTMNSLALGGAGWTYYETIPGGSGAGPGFNGESCVQCHMTNTLNTPAEALELQYPLRVRRFERAAGTGGAGKYHGGDGVVRRIEALADCEGTLLAERRTHAPYGIAGGEDARAGEDRIHVCASGQDISQKTGKFHFSLKRGDVLTIRAPGGGGHGKFQAIR